MEITDIKSRLSLATVLHYYGLKPDKNMRLQCPFHDDKSQSLQLYYKTHTAYCFSTNCKTHGKSLDVIDFVMHKENCDKHNALLKSVEILGGNKQQKPVQTTNETKTTTPEDSIQRQETLSKIFTYFSNGFIVRHDNKAAIYLQSRNLNVSKLQHLCSNRIGQCNNARAHFTQSRRTALHFHQ